MRMVRPGGRLLLQSTPPGATFTVNGQTVGKAPTGVDVSAFTQVKVSASLPGHKPWSSRVYLKSRKETVHARLEPLAKPPVKGRAISPAAKPPR
jgi:hypothetical protein